MARQRAQLPTEAGAPWGLVWFFLVTTIVGIGCTLYNMAQTPTFTDVLHTERYAGERCVTRLGLDDDGVFQRREYVSAYAYYEPLTVEDTAVDCLTTVFDDAASGRPLPPAVVARNASRALRQLKQERQTLTAEVAALPKPKASTGAVTVSGPGVVTGSASTADQFCVKNNIVVSCGK